MQGRKVKVYFDDFLIDAGIKSDAQKNLIFPLVNQFTEKVITEYINEKISIKVNDKQVTAELENVDLTDNELRVNLSFDSVSNVKTITIKNLIMTSIYDDQANMTIVRVNDFEEGIKFTPAETEKVFIIN